MDELAAPDFSLQATLTSGQTFRWKQDHGWFYGVLGPIIVKVKQEGDRLFYTSSDPVLVPGDLEHYLGLDVNIRQVLSSIDVDMQIHHAITSHRGLRVLRQEAWEALASFICASFNNIKRIEGMIERLCQAYGEPVSMNGCRSFTFPRPEKIAGTPERHLRSLGLGYRAPYLRSTAKLVADGKLPIQQLRRTDYETTKIALLGCDGVGDKVADCVALFGFEKYEAFPIDVWVERAMRYYFRHRKVTRRQLHEYARRHFGPYAGYAQQYLYHYVRNLRVTNGNGWLEPIRN